MVESNEGRDEAIKAAAEKAASAVLGKYERFAADLFPVFVSRHPAYLSEALGESRQEGYPTAPDRWNAYLASAQAACLIGLLSAPPEHEMGAAVTAAISPKLRLYLKAVGVEFPRWFDLVSRATVTALSIRKLPFTPGVHGPAFNNIGAGPLSDLLRRPIETDDAIPSASLGEAILDGALGAWDEVCEEQAERLKRLGTRRSRVIRWIAYLALFLAFLAAIGAALFR